MEIIIFALTVIGAILILLAEFVSFKLSIPAFVCGVLAILLYLHRKNACTSKDEKAADPNNRYYDPNKDDEENVPEFTHPYLMGAASSLIYGVTGLAFFVLCVGRALGKI